MRKNLRCESLEPRECPSTAADIASHYAPGWDPMPGVPQSQVGVATFESRGSVYDLYYATTDSRGAPRLIVHDTQSGKDVLDRFVFDDHLRGGINSLTVIGETAFVSAGLGAGPVICAINLPTLTFRYTLAPGFAESWREGLRLFSADTDLVNGTETAPGGEELIVLPGGTGGAPVAFILDPATGKYHLPPIYVGPVDFRGAMEIAPASGGVQLSTGRMGAIFEEVGRPETSRGVGWDGSFAPHDYVDDATGFHFAPILV